MSTNEEIKNISLIYDDLAEEVRKTRRNSLPLLANIERGVNYTSFKNLYSFLKKFDLVDPDSVRLYIRTQYEMLWNSPKYNNKVIHINMMYNPNSMDRFIDFVKIKQEKLGAKRAEKYLENYSYTALVPDENCLSLSTDTSLVLNYLIKQSTNREITSVDVVDAVCLIENGSIQSISINSICPAYLLLNKYIDFDNERIQELFSTKIVLINKTLKSRSKRYKENLQNKKTVIISRLMNSTPNIGKNIVEFI